MKLNVLFIFGLLTLSTGCAFTVHDLPVNYEYTGELTIPDKSNLPEIVVGEIKDMRTVENPRMLMNMKNGYGVTTTGGWQAEKELALIVQDALKQGIANANLNLPTNRQITLEGQLLDVTSNVFAGYTRGSINVKVAVKLSARNKAYGEIIWRDTVFGDGTSDKQKSFTNALLEAFANSLDNLVENVFQDEYFQQKVLN